MPPKAKPDTAAYQKLKKDIKEGTIGTLYVFHGEEAYLRDFYLGQLKKKLLPAGMEEFNLHTLSGKEFDVKTLAQLVDCLPMMSERTLIVVNDYDIYKGDKDALAAVLRELPDYVCLVFVYDLIEYKADARTKLAALLKGTIVFLLTAGLLAFVGYLTASGAIAGSADAAAVKAAKMTISRAIPVVGGILSDAAETVLAGAGVLRGTVGVVGMLVVLAIC